MRRAFTSLLAFGLVLSAAAYPAVSSGPVALNQWNKNLTAALAKARELNRPAMVAVVDSVTCSYSPNGSRPSPSTRAGRLSAATD